MDKLIYNGRPATKKLTHSYLTYTFSDMWRYDIHHFITIWYYGGYFNTRTDDSFSDNGSYRFNNKNIDNTGYKLW